MATYGKPSITGTPQSALISGPSRQIIFGGFGIATPGANEALISFSFLSNTGTSTGDLEFALYDVTGLPTDNPAGAVLVPGTEATILSGDITPSVTNTVVLGTPVPLDSAKDYSVGIKIASGTVYFTRETGASAVMFEANAGAGNPTGAEAWSSPFLYEAIDTIGSWEYVISFDTQTVTPSATIDSYPSSVEFGGTGYAITTTGFGTITGMKLKDGTSEFDLTTFTDTTFDVDGLGDVVQRVLTGSVSLEITDGTATVETPVDITLNAPSDRSVTTLAAGFDSGPTSWLYQWGGTPVAGLQALWLTADFTSFGDDGSWEKNAPGTSVVYVIDPSDGVMESFNLTVADTTPDAFSFTDQSDVPLSSLRTSDTITVAGITDASAISITGGNYSINGGAYTSSSGTVNNGDTVTLQVTSSASNSTSTNVSLTIGGVSDTWNVVTEAAAGADTTPDAFTFTDQTGIAVSTQVQSNTITVAGINAAATIGVSGAGGEYSINGGGFTSSVGTVSNGDTVQLRVTSSSSNSVAVMVTLNIGGVTDTWTVTTEAAQGSVSTYSISQRILQGNSTAFASKTLDYAVFTDFAGTLVNSGQVTTDTDGNLTISSLPNSGVLWLALKDPADSNVVSYFSVTAA